MSNKLFQLKTNLFSEFLTELFLMKNLFKPGKYIFFNETIDWNVRNIFFLNCNNLFVNFLYSNYFLVDIFIYWKYLFRRNIYLLEIFVYSNIYSKYLCFQMFIQHNYSKIFIYIWNICGFKIYENCLVL